MATPIFIFEIPLRIFFYLTSVASAPASFATVSAGKRLYYLSYYYRRDYCSDDYYR
jgi:hypothetical protein